MLPLTVGTYFGAVEVLGWPWCDGSLKAAAAAITVFVSVQWPQLGRKRTGGYRTQRGVVTQSGGNVRSNVVNSSHCYSTVNVEVVRECAWAYL